MDEIEDRYKFTFLVDADGRLTKSPPFPWRVGPPENRISIQLLNDHAGQLHRVRMVRFKHKESRRALDPLTGTKQWQSFGTAPSDPSIHKVRNHPDKYDKFEFRTEFDGVEGEDPELIVDEPPRDKPPKKKMSGSRKAAKAGKAASRKSAKKGGAKKEGAKKAARKAGKKAGRKKR
jgi:hypothetical protein